MEDVKSALTESVTTVRVLPLSAREIEIVTRLAGFFQFRITEVRTRVTLSVDSHSALRVLWKSLLAHDSVAVPS